MSRRLALWLGLPLGLVAALLLAAGLALHAPGGLRVVFDWLAGQVPGELAADTVEGSLAGPWRVEGLRYRDAQGTDVALEGLALEWRPAALLTGLLHVKALRTEGLVITAPAGEDESEPSSALPDLPLRIDIDALALERIELTVGDGDPVRIARVALAGGSVSRLRGARLKSLRVEAEQGHLQVSGRVDPWRDYRHDIQGDVRLVLPGRPEATGRFRAKGDAGRSEVGVDLDAPLRAGVVARIDTPLTAPAWEARLEARTDALAALDPGLPSWPAELLFEGRGTLERAAGTLAAALTHPEFGRLTADGAVEGDRTRIDLGQVTLRAGEPEMRLRLAAASVALDGDVPVVDASGSWQALRWPPTGTPQVGSPNGRFTLSGTPEAYALDLAGRVELPAQPGFELALAGQGTPQGLDLTRWAATLDQAGGRLAGTGSVAWAPALQAVLEGAVERLDPGRFAGDWPGVLDGTFSAVLETTPAGPAWRLDLADLGGTLRGQPLRLRGGVDGGADGVVTLRDLEGAAGGFDAILAGRVAPALDLRLELSSAALDGALGFAPGLEGRLTARGTVTGAYEAPAVRLEAQAEELRHPDFRARQLTLTGQATAGLDGALALDLQAADLVAGGRRVSRLALTGAGTLADHAVDLEAEVEDQAVAFALAGGLSGGTWQGRATRGHLDGPEWGRLQLDGTAPLRIAATEGRVDAHCWRRWREGAPLPGELCGGGRWQRDGFWEADLRLVDLPLRVLDLALPEGVALAGELAGEARFQGAPGGAVEGRAALRLGPGHVDLGGLVAGAAPIAYRAGRAEVATGGDGITATFGVDLEGDDRVTGRVALPGYVLGGARAADPALDGTVTLALTRLDLLATLAPTLGLGPGRLDGRLDLGGTLGAPTLDGRATLDLETVEVPQYGLVLREARLEVRGEGADAVHLDGRVRSGDGELRVAGEVARDPEAGVRVDLGIDGSRFTAVDLHALHLLVSPRMKVRLRGRDLAVDGRLEVPEALIRPQLGGASLQNPSADAVVVGGEAEREPADPLRIDANVRLALGDAVRFEGFGLRGRVAGALDIVQRPDAIPLASGELNLVDGSFNRYGQDLRIESGRLQYANSPLDDPGIEAEAVRTVGQVRAGIRLTGRLSAMETTVFSEPPMAQADALSYLVLGAPPGQSGGADAGKVAAASAALGFLAKQTGIESLSVESDAVGDAVSLVIGQYLSPELYVGYAVGLTSPTNTFIARYRLTKRLSVEASSGTGSAGAFSGADLKYVIER